MKKIYLLLYCCLNTFLSWSQDSGDSLLTVLGVKRDSVYAYNRAEILHDAILLPDGRLVVVGETYQKALKKNADENHNGLLLLLDPETGAVLERQEFGGAYNDALLSVAQSADGDLYAVGYADKGKGFGKQGWIIRWDEVLEKVTFDTVIGGSGDDQFQKIIWLDSDIGIVAGIKGSDNKPGYLWFNTIQGRKLTEVQKQIGDGLVEDITHMAPGPDNHVWLCGNVRTREAKKNANTWILLLDEYGTAHKNLKEGDTRGWVSISGAGTSIRRDLLLSGRIWIGDSGRTKAWAASLDEEADDATSHYFKENPSDGATAVCAMPFDSFIVVVRRPEGCQLMVVTKDGQPQAACLLKGFDNKEAVRLVRTPGHGYIAAGTAPDPNFNQQSVRLISLVNMPLPGRKTTEVPKLKYSELKLLESNDQHKDGFVSPGEAAALSFRIENIDGTDILSGGMVTVEGAQVAKDMVLPRPRNMPILLKDMSQVVTVPLRIKPDATTKSIAITIMVRINNQPALSIPYTIKVAAEKIATGTPAPAAPPAQGTGVIYRKPDVRAVGTREVEADDRNYTIEIDIVSSKKNMSANDPVAYKNNIRQTDQKARRELGKPVPEGDKVAYRFTYDMQLNEGRNAVYFQIDDYQSDSIVINYTTYKPDLHVVVIGVPYDKNDLKYTVKDAQDLAKAWANQKGKFFSNVHVDTLTTADLTSATNIYGAFEELQRRFDAKDDPRRIKPRDYLVVCISSHGIIRRDGRFGLVASDYDPVRQRSTSVDYQAVLDEFLSKVQCKRLLFIDACHSGGGNNSKVPLERDLNNAQRRAYEAFKGLTVFTSSSREEFSYEYPTGENGVFTEALTEALAGKPVKLITGEMLPVDNPAIDRDPQGKGIVTIGELRAFIYKRIPDLLARSGQTVMQTPEVLLEKGQEDSLPLFSID